LISNIAMPSLLGHVSLDLCHDDPSQKCVH